MKYSKILLCIIIFFTTLPWRGIGGKSAFAQTYPVQLTTQLLPPYSGYLPDYADPTSEKLRIILQFNDFTVPQYNIRLKIEIKGNGFSIITKQLFIPPPITVQPGIPVLISGIDLAPYLNSNNLDFIGINQNQYEQGKALPEGYYTLCITAYDYYQTGNTQVSNESCAQAWFTLSDPPLLNLPFCNSTIPPLTPQNILFQWTPMNMGSPNSALTTEYDFEMWEIRPDSTANQNQIVLSTPPVFVMTTQQTFINYGISEPPLNLYMRYVWRVRARDISGRDLFKNYGYSQVCTFTYGSMKNALSNALSLTLNAQGITHRMGKCTWNTQSVFTNYLLQVRKKGTTHWFDYPTIQNTEKITNLEPETTYEAQVRGFGEITGDWSNIAVFTTLKESVYSCNDQSQVPDPLQAAALPVSKAIPNLIIQSGQFEITVSEILSTGAPGWYKGTGTAQVFGDYSLEVQWSNIYIDDNNRHQQGIIETVTDGITEWVQQWDLQKAEENATYTNGTIDSVYINGNQVCILLQGSSTAVCYPVPPGTNVFVIRDEEGNQYTVTLVPAPPKIEGPTNYLTLSADVLEANDSLLVTFSASATQHFGFDKKEYTAYSTNYEVIKLKNGKNYFVPYKSLDEGKTDEVIAELKIINFNPGLLYFTKHNGVNITASATNIPDQYNVSIPYDANAVYAWYDNKKIGKLNVIHLKPLSKKVVIVPVNNTAINGSTLQKDLNNIYKQANITWTVNINSNFTFDLGNDGLEFSDATLMTKYSTEMRSLRDAYRKTDTAYDKNAYYIFVIPGFTDLNYKGYMVRGRAVGFVAPLSAGEGPGVRLLAHELAHGAFGLEHTFPLIDKSTTNNLLDYGAGTTLTKIQWLEMYSSKFVYNWLDSEEDAALIDSRIYVLETLNKIKTAHQNDADIPNNELPSPKNAVRIEKTLLAGITYDFIQLEINSQKVSIHPKGKITQITATNMYGTTLYGLDIDEKVKVFVPQNRVANMELFLTSPADRNFLLFVNGYLLDQEMIKSADVVYQSDVWDYWSGIDAAFINTITTRNAIYASGNDYIITSNHVLHTEVAKSMSSMYSLFPYLNTTPNAWGFKHRFDNGKKAGIDLITKLYNGTITCRKTLINGKAKIIDTMDVVAHSMGFAYSLGMISEIQKANIHVGRFYIIAPENGCSGILPSNLEEAWQYGSNEILDPVREQDGIAPQCKVGGIDLYGSNGGRAYIPGNVPKGFTDSHVIKNYGWIFNKNSYEIGYVKKRN